MSSTYSSYKFELIGTGEQAGTWGTTTNTNLGTAIEQAIGGYVTVNFTTTTNTLTLSNSNAAQDARALYLNLTGSPGGAATLEVPAIQKAYIIKNATTGGYTVTVKVTGMTGVDIPNGKTMLVYNNGTDVVVAHDNFSAPVTINANSASDALRITQIGAGNALLVEDSANPDTSPFVIDAAGKVGIGATSITGANNLYISRTVTGNTTGVSVYNNWTVAADVTGSGASYRSDITTVASPFTLAFLSHFNAALMALGAGSTVTTQAAFVASSAISDVASNNYATNFTINTGSNNNWNLYSSGTANNYLAGSLGIGTTTLTGYGLRVSKALTGAVSSAEIAAAYTVQSDVTSVAKSFQSVISTQAASFTLSTACHFIANDLNIGAGSAVTDHYGFLASLNLGSVATNNYGFFSELASGTGNWNFYADGTANNAFRGNTRFGGLTAPVATVDVTGSVAATTSILSSGATSGVGYTTGAGGAVTQATGGADPRTNGVTLNKTTGAITLVSAAGSTTYKSFTVTNSAVAATDVVIVNQKSGTDKYIILVTNVAAGSFQITFATTGGTTTEQPVFNFAVIKAVAA